MLRMMVFLLIQSLLFAQPQEFAGQMHELEKSFGGRIGFMAKNLRTGEVLAYADQEKFPTASTIKLPVMVEYFYQIAEGKISLTQKAILSDSNKVGGSGLYQYFSGTTEQQLADAVMMMITVSDNSATNLVIDALGKTLPEKLAAVNQRMQTLGLKNTRLRNKLMAWKTKTDSAESIRYGIGVSTRADMVLLLEKMYRGELVDSTAGQRMREILSQQFYNDLLPRYLPFETNPDLQVAHKTGSVTGVQADVGLVLSAKADIAIAVYCEQSQDRRDGYENLAGRAIATAGRMAWNHFTNDSGFDRPFVTSVDWTSLPGGQWTRVNLKNALYPHASRKTGNTYKEQSFPFDPHYCDSSVVMIVPNDYHEENGQVDLIVHFHGWYNDVLGVLEQFYMPQQLIASRKNAILVLAQGPYRAADSGGGKMEDEGGFRRLVDEVVQVLNQEGKVHSTRIGRVIVTAHSGGYRPAIYSVSRGGLQDKISEVYLFDAFYALTEELVPWLKADKHHHLRSIYTEHLAAEHQKFMVLLKKNKLSWADHTDNNRRIVLTPTSVCHNCVINPTFLEWLKASSLAER
jgi:beta-lactamase class A